MVRGKAVAELVFAMMLTSSFEVAGRSIAFYVDCQRSRCSECFIVAQAQRFHPEHDHKRVAGTRRVVHGDDFTFVGPLGPREDLQRMTQLMEAWYQMKVRAVLGKRSKRRQGNIVAQQVGEVEV